MSYIQRINRKLERTFGSRVSAAEDRGCLVLEGTLERWDDVVRAGLLAVNKRRYIGLVNRIACTGETCPPMRVPPLADKALDGQTPDVLIIGGGVVGCAILRELSRYSWTCCCWKRNMMWRCMPPAATTAWCTRAST